MTDTNKLVLDVKQTLKTILLNTGSTMYKGIARYIVKTQVFADTSCDTAYAAPIKGGKLKIGINPDFYLSLPENYRFPLLAHEMFHIIMRHFVRFEYPTDTQKAYMLNIALDCAINQLIAEFAVEFAPDCHFAPINLHSFTTMVEKAGYSGVIEANQDANYYLKILLSLPNPPSQPSLPKSGNGGLPGTPGGQGKSKPGKEEGEGEGSGPWIENHEPHAKKSGDADDEPEPGDIEKIVDDIARDLRDSGCGDSDLQKLGLAKRSEVVPWKKIFKSFLANKLSDELKTDRNKPHRKYGLALPKRRVETEAEFILLLDTTGSMYGDLPYVFAEVERFAKLYNAPFDIWICDTGLHGPYKAKNSTAFKSLSLPQGGGTDFRCIANLPAKGVPVVFFTDTYGQWPQNRVPYPLLVLKTCEGGTPDWVRSVDISEAIAAQKAA